MTAGQVNFRGSLPRSASYVLELSMLHPDMAEKMRNNIIPNPNIFMIGPRNQTTFSPGMWKVTPFLEGPFPVIGYDQ